MFEQFRWNFHSPEERGDIGENIIYSALNKVRGRKALLPNCYIPVGQKGTTEIDMIFLHESGLYVIESKNYSGWIFGNEEQDHWTQCLRGKFHTTQKHSFYNPLRQNETHICALMELLKDDTVPYYSYVVFGNNCELKNVQLTSGKHHVSSLQGRRRVLPESALQERHREVPYPYRPEANRRGTGRSFLQSLRACTWRTSHRSDR